MLHVCTHHYSTRRTFLLWMAFNWLEKYTYEKEWQPCNVVAITHSFKHLIIVIFILFIQHNRTVISITTLIISASTKKKTISECNLKELIFFALIQSLNCLNDFLFILPNKTSTKRACGLVFTSWFLCTQPRKFMKVNSVIVARWGVEWKIVFSLILFQHNLARFFS